MVPAELGALSPFELDAHLHASAVRSPAHRVLDAGKGQPNWLAVTPRRAYHLLGGFALQEAQRDTDDPDAGWRPDPAGAADRLATFLDDHMMDTGAGLLRAVVDHGVARLGFAPDTWVGELVDGILGDRYPHPQRMLVGVEQLVHEYLLATHCNGDEPAGRYRLFATEGGAAAMTYVFQSLRANAILRPGHRIAIGTPVFSPYLEIPTLEEFGLEIVRVRADPATGWRYSDRELAKLADPAIRAFFLVNPGNPDTRSLAPDELAALSRVVRDEHPELLIIADTAYATFVEDFRSLLAELPENTIGVHSFSKHFGATGARLAFIALHEHHVVDRLMAGQDEAVRALQRIRYQSVTDDLDGLAFIDRAAADSRDVALYHIAGLSTPQQVQMALFASFFLLGQGGDYIRMTRQVLAQRLHSLLDPLGVPLPVGADTHYYTLLDVLALMRARHGQEAARWLEEERSPLEFPIALAERHGVITLPGKGFEATDWTVRVSLANLPDAAYGEIAAAVSATVDELHGRYQDRLSRDRITPSS